jgi:formate-dependent nitrite reductase cytochrome c552 subunit
MELAEKGYLAALLDRCSSIHITKNVKRLGVFILEPAIEINLINKDVANKVSEILKTAGINSGISVYNIRNGNKAYQSYKVRVYKNEDLLKIINFTYPYINERERIDVLKLYTETREEKKKENKKARYGITELELYRKLKAINELHYIGYIN